MSSADSPESTNDAINTIQTPETEDTTEKEDEKEHPLSFEEINIMREKMGLKPLVREEEILHEDDEDYVHIMSNLDSIEPVHKVRTASLLKKVTGWIPNPLDILPQKKQEDTQLVEKKPEEEKKQSVISKVGGWISNPFKDIMEEKPTKAPAQLSPTKVIDTKPIALEATEPIVQAEANNQHELTIEQVNKLRSEMGKPPLPTPTADNIENVESIDDAEVQLLEEEQDSGISKFVDYVVTDEDVNNGRASVFSMALAHNMELHEFLAVNHLDLMDELYTTQKLKVPNPQYVPPELPKPEVEEEVPPSAFTGNALVEMFLNRYRKNISKQDEDSETSTENDTDEESDEEYVKRQLYKAMKKGKLGENYHHRTISLTKSGKSIHEQLDQICKEDYTPELIESEKGSVLSSDQLKAIHTVLPHRFQHRRWKLLYSTREHGISLRTLLTRASEQGPSVLVVHTTDAQIIGAFLSEPLRDFNRYYGTGETFAFSFNDEKVDENLLTAEKQTELLFNCYRWTRANSHFIYSTQNYIAIGGGEKGGCAIRLDSDLTLGSSYPCETFGNESPLIKANGLNDFNIHTVELWGFEVRTRYKTSATPAKTPLSATFEQI
jgi:hypothetical protein